LPRVLEKENLKLLQAKLQEPPRSLDSAPCDPVGFAGYLADKLLLNIHCRQGYAEHYFHFLLGFFVPLVDFLGDKKVTVAIRDCGPLSRIIHEYADERIHMLPKGLHDRALSSEPIACPVVNLLGFDSVDSYDPAVFARVKKNIYGRLPSMTPFFSYKYDQQNLENGYCLIIDRAKPLPYYRVEPSAEKQGGANRRSVSNLFSIYQQIRKSQPAVYVLLELLPFWEQVLLVRHARTIIGQHGAGLANMLWAEKPASVIEICTRKDPPYFEKLAAAVNLQFAKFFVDGDHVALPPGEFLSFVSGH
jgi:hypothetical protein